MLQGMPLQQMAARPVKYKSRATSSTSQWIVLLHFAERWSKSPWWKSASVLHSWCWSKHFMSSSRTGIVAGWMWQDSSSLSWLQLPEGAQKAKTLHCQGLYWWDHSWNQVCFPDVSSTSHWPRNIVAYGGQLHNFWLVSLWNSQTDTGFACVFSPEFESLKSSVLQIRESISWVWCRGFAACPKWTLQIIAWILQGVCQGHERSTTFCW